MGKYATLQREFDPRSNSFDFLRFVLAALVVLSHCYPLGGFAAEPLTRFSHGQESFGSLAVAGFFALSGFLITRSYVLGNALLPFVWNRCLRIFPAFWVCLVLTGFVWVPLLYASRYGMQGGFWSEYGHEAWRYVTINAPLKIRQWGIRPVFDENPYTGVLNGSLWSLHYEFRCYLLVAGIGMLGLLSRRRLVLCTFVALWAANVACRLSPDSTAFIGELIEPLMLKLLVWFLAGSVFYLYRNRIRLDGRLCLLCVLLTGVAMRWRFLPAVFPLTLTYSLFWCGVYFPLRRFGRRGDYSYGLYIYAFPVQQTLAFCGVHLLGFGIYFSLSMLCTLPLAVASYHLVEKPALRWKLRWGANRGANRGVNRGVNRGASTQSSGDWMPESGGQTQEAMATG